MLQHGRLPVVKGLSLTRDDLVRRSIIMALMCQGRVDLREIEQSHLLDFNTYFARELIQFQDFVLQGMVTLNADAIEVTPVGWYLVRAIAMVFDKYAQADGQRAHFSKIL